MASDLNFEGMEKQLKEAMGELLTSDLRGEIASVLFAVSVNDDDEERSWGELCAALERTRGHEAIAEYHAELQAGYDHYMALADAILPLIEARLSEERERCAEVAARLDPDALKCVNGHDRCGYGPDEDCPYCENRSPIAAAIRALTPQEPTAEIAREAAP